MRGNYLTTLFKSERYIAEIFNPGRKRLAVTFDHWRRERDGFPANQPGRLFDDLDYSQLSIVSSTNDWFLSDDTWPLMEALGRLRQHYVDIIHYGFSMGGFAAFLFANAIRPDRIIAVSPQYSIDRSIVPFETRWPIEASHLPSSRIDIAEMCPSDTPGYVVFDPRVEADKQHAKMIMRVFAGFVPVRLSWGGHPATLALQRCKLAGAAGRMLLAGRPPSDIEDLHKEAIARVKAMS